MNYAERYINLYKANKAEEERIATIRKAVADGVSKLHTMTIDGFKSWDEAKKSLPALDDALAEQVKQFHKMQYDFPELYRQWCALDSSKIDDADLKLLNPLFADQDTILQLADKHRNNPTMMHAIRQYAKANDLTHHLPENNDTFVAMNQLFSMANKAEQDPNGYYAHLLAKDGALDGIISQVDMP